MKHVITKLIEEIANEVLNEKLRSKGFNIREFKALSNVSEMADYCRDKGLKYLGAGISRITYLLSSGKAIKIAYARDVSQNSGDVAAFDFFGSDYVPKIYDKDPEYRWIIVELVNTFSTEQQLRMTTGGLTNTILSYLRDYLQINDFILDIEEFVRWGMINSPYKEIREDFKKLQSGLTPKGIELLEKCAFLYKKSVSDINRFDHWGIGADQRIVCVDAGIGGDA